MAEQRLNLQTRQVIGRCEPQTVHPRVDHDIARAARRAPARNLFGRVQDRPGARGARCRHVGLAYTMEDREVRIRREKRLNLGRLIPGRDEEVPASGGQKVLGHLNRAEPVSVGLHGRAAIGSPPGRFQPAPVMGQGIAVKAQTQRRRHQAANSRAHAISANLPCPTFPAARSARRGTPSRPRRSCTTAP